MPEQERRLEQMLEQRWAQEPGPEQKRRPVVLVAQRVQLVELALGEQGPLEVAEPGVERVPGQAKLGAELGPEAGQGYAHDVAYQWG